MVTLKYIATLCLVEASKFLLIVYSYVIPNTRSVPMMNTQVDPITVFSFIVDNPALNVSRN